MVFGEGTRIQVLLLVRDDEMKVGSSIVHLKHSLKTIPHEVLVLDNGSSDRSSKVSTLAGARVFRFERALTREGLLRKALEIGRKDEADIVVILDVDGGNTTDDVLTLVMIGIEKGDQFASAFVQPTVPGEEMGCWAFGKVFLKDLDPTKGGISDTLVAEAMKKKLDVRTIDQKNGGSLKRMSTPLIRIPKRRPLEMFRNLRRHHPLKFYGGIGLVFLLISLGAGFYTVDYFYINQHLAYIPAFLTVGFLMIGGFFMVAGLMLNALNVMIERLEAMRRSFG